MTSLVSSTRMRSTTSCSTFCFTAKAGSVRALRMLAQNPSSPCRSRSSCSRSRCCCWSSQTLPLALLAALHRGISTTVFVPCAQQRRIREHLLHVRPHLLFHQYRRHTAPV